MGTAKTLVPHIAFDERGRAIVEGTTIKVKQLVLNMLGSGSGPEQLACDAHLSLAQVHAALLYYYEHKEQIDAEIERDQAIVDAILDRQPPGPTRSELLARRARMQVVAGHHSEVDCEVNGIGGQ